MKPYLRHLKSASDLKTSYEATRAGFVALALEKNRRSTPTVEEARALKAAASLARTPTDLLKVENIQKALVTAAGISDKARKHLEHQDVDDAVQGLIRNYLEPAGDNFVEELVFRFLLVRGDTLGGAMRNLGGSLAQRKLTRAIISALRLSRIPYTWQDAAKNHWLPMPEVDADIENFIRAISWDDGKKCRTIYYNLKIPFVGKSGNNVDLCLLSCDRSDLATRTWRDTVSQADNYIAVGELKGGIDPAGADEHWKTQSGAFARIRDAFEKQGTTPYLLFVGAAIESDMASEIWDDLEAGRLSNAANLTDDDQVASLVGWLCSL